MYNLFCIDLSVGTYIKPCWFSWLLNSFSLGYSNLCPTWHPFKKKIIYFNWRLITLQCCSGFCRTLTWISHGCTCVPHPEPPLPPPSSSHPSGLSQCIGFECPVSCIEPGLAIYFTYGNIHVQCCSLKSSHPRLLPQSPKVCSLHLCLFCCLTYRVIVTIFLDSIYMC